MKQHYSTFFFVFDGYKQRTLSNWFEKFTFAKSCHQSLGPLKKKKIESFPININLALVSFSDIEGKLFSVRSELLLNQQHSI